jgi:hypothetical protein
MAKKKILDVSAEAETNVIMVPDSGASNESVGKNDVPYNKEETADALAVFNERASELFSRYPNAKELYFTSDGYPFFDLSAATNHSRSLEIPELVKIIRN